MAKHKKSKKKKKLKAPVTLPPRKPYTLKGLVIRTWIIHAAALVVYFIFGLVGYQFLFGNTLYLVVSALSIAFYLAMCYILALRSGHRDNEFSAKSSTPISKWNTVLSSLISQAPGFVIAILLQFPVNPVLRAVYEYIYMPFAYMVTAFEVSTKIIYFIPPLFAPIMMICAYFTGRMAVIKERKIPKMRKRRK